MASITPNVPEILAVRQDRGVKEGRERPGRAAADVLSVYLEGGPRYTLDGVTFELTPPVAILIPSGTQDHDQQVGRVVGSYVLFRGHGLVNRARAGHISVATGGGGARCLLPMLRRLSRTQALRMHDLLRRIDTSSTVAQSGRLLRVAYLLEAISDYCGDRGPEGHGVHREAERLRELIESRAYEDIPMTRLYQELAVSAGRAATLFARAFGASPVAYRVQIRMNRARELLVSTRRNVSEVAYAVGFGDPLYFARVFRKHFGRTPSSLIRDFSVSRR